MANLTPAQKLATGRILVRRKAPYLYTAVMALVPKEAPGLGTFGVTASGVLFWDPEFARQCTPEQVAWVLIHEASHVLRHHDERCKKKVADPKLWNVAADCEINDDIVAMKGDLPGDFCLASKMDMEDGGLAETYYNTLRKRQPPQQKGGQGEGGGGEGGEQDGGGGRGDGDGQSQGDGGGQPPPGAGWCGSGAGRKLPNEPKDEGGRSPADLDRVRRQTAEDIKKAVEKNQGNVPAGWQVWADEIIKPPKVRWQDKLRRACRRAVTIVEGQVDYSYHRPSRRQAAYGYGKDKPIRPTMIAPVPRVVVGLDTSGSMMGDSIMLAANEIVGILKTVETRVDFLACDAEVHTVTKLKSPAQFKDVFKGGGGTSFVPAFEAVEKIRPRPDIFIFLTDGYGDAPATPPRGMHVIWVLCGRACVPYKRDGKGHITYGEMLWVNVEEEKDAA